MMEPQAIVHTMTTGANSSIKVEKVERPTISSACTSEDWNCFVSSWKHYVEVNKVTGKELITQLLECCDDNLRREFKRSTGEALDDMSEDHVLKVIRKLAVREENPMVARFTLINMTQGCEETVRSFGARLSDQAGVCKFIIQCDCCDQDVNYTDDILRDVVIRGLDDPEIQAELVCDQKENMTLEQVFQFVETKEAGKHSAAKSLDTQRTKKTSSLQPRNKKPNLSTKWKKSVKHQRCKYCGIEGHGVRARVKDRKKHCSAYGHLCTNCNKRHHMESVCPRKSGTLKVETEDVDLSEGEEIDNMFDEQAPLSDASIEEINNMFDETPLSPCVDMDNKIKIKTEDNNMMGDESLPLETNNTPQPPRVQKAKKTVPASRAQKAKKTVKASRKPKAKKINATEKKQRVCTVCNRIFPFPFKLKEHMTIHTGEKSKICDVCGARFARSRMLIRHMKTHSQEKHNVCNVCNKSFVYRNSLRLHMSIHTGEKRHECKVCHKEFRLASILTQHMFTHSEERNVVCKVCGQTFKHIGILIQHMLVHTGVRKFVCKVCGKAFKISDSLTRHMRTHTGEKPHMCNICGKAFSGSGSLTRHVNLHTGEKSHVCSFCGKTFNDRANWRRHMKKHTAETQ